MAVNISAGGGPEGEWGSAARAGQAGQVMRGTGDQEPYSQVRFLFAINIWQHLNM